MDYTILASIILDDQEAKRRWISIFNNADVRSMQVSALAHFLERVEELKVADLDRLLLQGMIDKHGRG